MTLKESNALFCFLLKFIFVCLAIPILSIWRLIRKPAPKATPKNKNRTENESR